MSVGVLLVAYVGVLVGYQSYQQHRLESAWDAAHPAGTVHDAMAITAGAGGASFLRLQPHLSDGQPLARLRIPRINFEAIVTEGLESGVLSAGPGHENHTGYPGEGHIILVGNHNGFSLSWGDLHTGDAIQLEMGYGRYTYTISKRQIVSGDDQAVVRNPQPGEHLYLTTCWPLWQGALAGERLVFTADPSGSRP
jgi:sortase A